MDQTYIHGFSFYLEILSKWPLFGSSFFAVKRVPEGKEKGADHILALNRHGVHFIDLITHVSVSALRLLPRKTTFYFT